MAQKNKGSLIKKTPSSSGKAAVSPLVPPKTSDSIQHTAAATITDSEYSIIEKENPSAPGMFATCKSTGEIHRKRRRKSGWSRGCIRPAKKKKIFDDKKEKENANQDEEEEDEEVEDEETKTEDDETKTEEDTKTEDDDTKTEEEVEKEDKEKSPKKLSDGNENEDTSKDSNEAEEPMEDVSVHSTDNSDDENLAVTATSRSSNSAANRSKEKILEEVNLCNGDISNEEGGDSHDSMKVTSAGDELAAAAALASGISPTKASVSSPVSLSATAVSTEAGSTSPSSSNIVPITPQVEATTSTPSTSADKEESPKRRVTRRSLAMETEDSVVSSSEQVSREIELIIDWSYLEAVYESCISATTDSSVEDLLRLHTTLSFLANKHIKSTNRTPLLQEVETEIRRFAQFHKKT